MTSQRDDELDPDAMMASLGLGVDDGPLPELGSLDELKKRLHGDLDEKQGGFRGKSSVARSWPLGVAVLVGIGFAFALSPAALNPLALASVVAAGLAAACAFVAVLLAPSSPGRGERVALVSLVAGGLALGLQMASGLGGASTWSDALPGSFKCSGMLLAGTAVPLLLLVAWMRRSGLPVRALHAAGVAVAAFALGGLGTFRHCAPLETWHTLFAHLVAPAVGATVVAWVMYRLMQRRLDS